MSFNPFTTYSEYPYGSPYDTSGLSLKIIMEGIIISIIITYLVKVRFNPRKVFRGCMKIVKQLLHTGLVVFVSLNILFSIVVLSCISLEFTNDIINFMKVLIITFMCFNIIATVSFAKYIFGGRVIYHTNGGVSWIID